MIVSAIAYTDKISSISNKSYTSPSLISIKCESKCHKKLWISPDVNMHWSSTQSNNATESNPNGNNLQSGQGKFRTGSEFMWLKPVFNSWITKVQPFFA